ncbi:MAG: hypothetical protein HUK20_03035 [Fibrobacter sp.]|nr:hypothetical protein [Fibrobacter sp.]
MKKIFLLMLCICSISFSRPTVVYTGVYTLSNEKTKAEEKKNLVDLDVLVPMFYKVFATWQNDGNTLPFDLILETDAEETKHIAADPISMAILVTRDDIQIERFNTIGVTKTTLNLGLSVLFYQTRKTEKGTLNVVLASVPLNSYMSDETRDGTGENDLKTMMKKLAKELLQNRFKNRVKKIGIDEINVTIACNDKDCYIDDFKKLGLEVGQSVTVNIGSTNEEFFIKENDGSLEDAGNGMMMALRGMGKSKGYASNIRGYSDNTWQVISTEITSKKAAKLFSNEPTCEQIAQWYSDFLSGVGKAVLPPLTGVEWSTNSMGYTEMVLAKEDGELESFAMAPARNKVALGFTGVASKVIEKNKINEIWAFKIWLSTKVNNGKEKEEEFTTSKKTVVGTQDFREVDVFRDLLQVSTKKLVEKGN